MLIWYINHYATHPEHGRGGRAFQLQESLEALGHRMLVIHASYHHLMLRKQSVALKDWLPISTRNYRGNGIGRIFNILQFAFRLRKGLLCTEPKPDVIVYTSPHPFGWFAAWLLAKRLKVPLVLEVRDLWPESLIQILQIPRWNPVILSMSLWERGMVHTCDGLISLLKHCDEYYREKGWAQPPFCWISNGAEMDLEAGQLDADLEKEWQKIRSKNRRILLYAGSLGEPNGLLEFLNNPIPKEIQAQLQLVLLGAGSESERISKRIANQQMDWVSQLPAVSSREAQELISRSDGCFLYVKNLPLYRYGISMNKLFQYAASGKPVVGVMPERVKLASPWLLRAHHAPESIVKALERFVEIDDAQRDAMGRQAKEWVQQNYSWEQLAHEFAEFLNRLKQSFR